jgi:hypothetical protein
LIKDSLEPATIADVNGDNILELVTGSAVISQQFTTISTRTTDVGTVSGLPVVADLNGDGAWEIILMCTKGLFVFHSDYTLWWTDYRYEFQPPYYYNERTYLPSLVIGDVDNDGVREIFTLAFNGSYDDSIGLLTVTCYSGLGNQKWSVSRFFEPYNGVPVPWLADLNGDKTQELAFVDGKFSLEIYNAANGASPSFRYLNPLQVNGGKYFFLTRNDDGDTSLNEEDLATGQQRVVQDVVYIDKILGFPDDLTMLVSLDYGNLARLDIASRTYTEITSHTTYDDSCWAGNKMILANRGWTKSTYNGYNDDDALSRYDPATGQCEPILLDTAIQNLIYQNIGIRFTISGVSMQKKDDDHLYLSARVRYRNEFDPALPFEFNLMPAENQLPYLMEFEISTKTLSYKGIWQEYLKLSSFCYGNGHIYYLPCGRLDVARDYDLTTKTLTEYPVPAVLRNQYPDSGVVQVTTAGDHKLYVLIWQYDMAGGRLDNDSYNHHLFCLDMNTGQWWEVYLSGVYGLVCGITAGSDPNTIYLYSGPKKGYTSNISIYGLNPATGAVRELYSVFPHTFITANQPICSDGGNRIYFYLPKSLEVQALNYYDLNTGGVSALNLKTDCDAVTLLGAKDNHLYLAIQLMNEWNRFNIYDYQVDTKTLTLISSIYQPENLDPLMLLGATHFGYSTLNFSETGFDPATQTVYLTDTQNIFGALLTPPVTPTPTTPPTTTSGVVRPVLEFVYRNGDGKYTAVFGYKNESNQPVAIKIGPNNKFNP